MQILKKFAAVTKEEKEFLSNKIIAIEVVEDQNNKRKLEECQEDTSLKKYTKECANNVMELQSKVNFLTTEMKNVAEQLNEERHLRELTEKRIQILEMKLQNLENLEKHDVKEKDNLNKKTKAEKGKKNYWYNSHKQFC